MLSQIAFLMIFLVAFGVGIKKFIQIRRNIFLGKNDKITGDVALRAQRTALVAFGQQKMFKRFIPAIFHLFIYVAFLMTQVELIEILIDGFNNDHRFFQPYLGSFYVGVISFIEILSLLALIATFVFLARRNLLKIPRFHKDEMTGWPKLDGNIILYGEIFLVFFIFLMNCSDEALHVAQGKGSYGFVLSSAIAPALSGISESSLHLMERVGWWGHIIVVFSFLNYLPFSKHLHIMLAFPNVYYARLNSRGEMSNMPAIMNEVKSMMGLAESQEEEGSMDELAQFGANDVTSLHWTDVLGAYSCTECGRCTSVCPANITGKKLSPRKIMMDVRDRAEEIGKNLDLNNLDCLKPDEKGKTTRLTKENYDDGRSLFDYITKEEIHACTTCNACVEACPIAINPLDIILQLRRYEILDEAAGPNDWKPMFNSIENGGAVWQMSVERDQWTKDVVN